jgi:tetratricopeptide (TPR) repeat protein
MARGRIGKGVFVALMHFYVSTSLLILAVVLYMMRFSFVADHWQYFGSMGIIALAASGFTQALDRMGRWARPLEMGLGIALVLGLGALTRMQSGMYSGLDVLWRTTIARNPDCWMAYSNLGYFLCHHGRAEEGIADFREALRLNPDLAVAHNDLGVALFQQGQTEEAIAEFHEALRINPFDAKAHVSFGNALLQQGKIDDAITQYRQALEINPADADAHSNLGVALCQQGRMEEGIAQYREAIRLNPALSDAHGNLGAALFQQGQTEQAIAEYREAVRIDPANAKAHANLGNALLRQGRAKEAIGEYRQILDADSTNADVHYNLAKALLQDGETGQAIAEIEQALGLQPTNLAIKNTLAWMLAAAPQLSLRNGSRAVQLATEASQSSGGGNPVILRTLAAAYAQAGQFPNAIQTAQKALQLARAQSDTALVNALPLEIKLYESGHSFEEVR